MSWALLVLVLLYGVAAGVGGFFLGWCLGQEDREK